MLATLLSFIISLLVGFLIGIERERSHPEGIQFIGVRTFTLFSLLGTLIATIDQVAITITTTAFVFGIILPINILAILRTSLFMGLILILIAVAKHYAGRAKRYPCHSSSG